MLFGKGVGVGSCVGACVGVGEGVGKGVGEGVGKGVGEGVALYTPFPGLPGCGVAVAVAVGVGVGVGVELGGGLYTPFPGLPGCGVGLGIGFTTSPVPGHGIPSLQGWGTGVLRTPWPGIIARGPRLHSSITPGPPVGTKLVVTDPIGTTALPIGFTTSPVPGHGIPSLQGWGTGVLRTPEIGTTAL